MLVSVAVTVNAVPPAAGWKNHVRFPNVTRRRSGSWAFRTTPYMTRLGSGMPWATAHCHMGGVINVSRAIAALETVAGAQVDNLQDDRSRIGTGMFSSIIELLGVLARFGFTGFPPSEAKRHKENVEFFEGTDRGRCGGRRRQ